MPKRGATYQYTLIDMECVDHKADDVVWLHTYDPPALAS